MGTIQTYCTTEIAMTVLGGKWKAAIIKYLLESPHRYGELRARLPGITQRTLTKQLRELAQDGLVARHDHGEFPRRVDYSLTPLGRSLEQLIVALTEWGGRYRDHRLSAPTTPARIAEPTASAVKPAAAPSAVRSNAISPGEPWHHSVTPEPRSSAAVKAAASVPKIPTPSPPPAEKHIS